MVLLIRGWGINYWQEQGQEKQQEQNKIRNMTRSRSRSKNTHLLSDLRNMSSSACILQQRACLLWSEGQEVATRWWPSSREVAESTWRGVVLLCSVKIALVTGAVWL